MTGTSDHTRSGHDQRSIFEEATTDASGAFEITGLPGGSYRLFVDVPGVAMDTANADLTVDEDRPLELTALVGESGIVTQVEVVQGVEEELGLSVTVYPNPTTDVITLELPVGTAGGKRLVRIHDLRGKQQLLATFSASKYSLSLRQLPAGVYLLLIQNEEAATLSAIRIVKY